MPPLSRRALLLSLASGSGASLWPLHAQALPARALVFPRDHSAHPELRTEWWYITGHARVPRPAGDRLFGFQVTFFRTRVDAAQSIQSAFAAHQLVFAHAAVTDVQGQRLWHDQRIARAGMGIAQADTEDTRLKIRDWSLVRHAQGGYHARLPAGEFSLDLDFTPTQPLLLQGRQGLSRKGPQPQQASYYYSQPQLQAGGRLTLQGQSFEVAGRAWLDHEWSEELLHPDAVGWDWIGMNLEDGSALTAFRLRRADGSALWDGGSWRAVGGEVQAFGAVHVVVIAAAAGADAETRVAIQRGENLAHRLRIRCHRHRHGDALARRGVGEGVVLRPASAGCERDECVGHGDISGVGRDKQGEQGEAAEQMSFHGSGDVCYRQAAPYV